MSTEGVIEKLASLPVPDDVRLDYEYLVMSFMRRTLLKSELRKLTGILKENNLYDDFLCTYYKYKTQKD